MTLAHRIEMKRQLLRTMQMIYELVVHCEERKGVSWSNLSGFKATLHDNPDILSSRLHMIARAGKLEDMRDRK